MPDQEIPRQQWVKFFDEFSKSHQGWIVSWEVLGLRLPPGAGLSGRVALPAAYIGARRAKVPFVLWATIWAHPRTAAHALSYLPLVRMYRHADAIATYGPHVSAYVRSTGARGAVVEEAHQASVRVPESRQSLTGREGVDELLGVVPVGVVDERTRTRRREARDERVAGRDRR